MSDADAAGDPIAGRTIAPGVAEGPVLVSPEPISFYGAVDTETGEFIEEGHALTGENVAGKVLVFPKGKGSTVGSYVLYGLAQEGTAPAAIVNHETETIVATGAILGEVPCVDGIESAVDRFADGDRLRVDATEGTVTRLDDD
jgi:predicted aconitase with swiveling domain